MIICLELYTEIWQRKVLVNVTELYFSASSWNRSVQIVFVCFFNKAFT